MTSRLFGGLHKCAIPTCTARIPRGQVMCFDDYGLVPGWLKLKLSQARAYGVAWKCHPTQEYLELRDQAVRLVIREATRKRSRPQGQQLPLLPA